MLLSYLTFPIFCLISSSSNSPTTLTHTPKLGHRGLTICKLGPFNTNLEYSFDSHCFFGGFKSYFITYQPCYNWYSHFELDSSKNWDHSWIFSYVWIIEPNLFFFLKTWRGFLDTHAPQLNNSAKFMSCSCFLEGHKHMNLAFLSIWDNPFWV